MVGRWHSIASLVAPSYFISYSSKQRPFAEKLKQTLGEHAKRLWFDRESLFVGDQWLQEIRRGVAACDEVILLVSNESLQSRVVMEEEVGSARRLNKAIRPFIISTLDSGERLPAFVADIQSTNLSKLGESEAIRRICLHLNTIDPASDLKLKLCRGIYPRFSERLIGAEGQTEAAAICATIDRLLPGYDPASLLWLNAGLLHCATANWTKGVACLAEYAKSANSFVGWYFFALHCWHRRLILSSSAEQVRVANAAIQTALAIQPHPFAQLVAEVIESGGLNLGPKRIERWLEHVSAGLDGVRECPSETKRLYWCLQPSLRVLGRHASVVSNVLREWSHER